MTSFTRPQWCIEPLRPHDVTATLRGPRGDVLGRALGHAADQRELGTRSNFKKSLQCVTNAEGGVV